MASGSAARKKAPEKELEDVLGPVPKSTSKYIPQGFQRKNFVMHRDFIYKLKCLAYWENEPEYKVLHKVLEEFFAAHKVKPIPEKSIFKN